MLIKRGMSSGLFRIIKNAQKDHFHDFLERLGRHGPRAKALAVNSRDGEGLTPLMFAVAHKSRLGGRRGKASEHTRAIKAIMDELLSTEGIDLDAIDGWGRTALHLAANNNDQESCKLLIEAGADSNIEDNDYFTASSYALDAETSDICSSPRRIPDKLRHRHKPPVDKAIPSSTPDGLAFDTSSLTCPPATDLAEQLADEMVHLVEGGLILLTESDEESMAYQMDVLDSDPFPPRATKKEEEDEGRWIGKSHATTDKDKNKDKEEEEEIPKETTTGKVRGEGAHFP